MRTIHLTLSQIAKAIDNAKKYSTEWQAECCEIAMLPKIAKRWKEVNNYPELAIIRHPGKKYTDGDRDFNLSIGERKAWAEYAGYRLVYFKDNDGSLYGWNAVRNDGYGHGAAVAWDGMRREMRMTDAIHDLRMLVWYQREGKEVPAETLENIARYGIKVII